MFCFLERTFSSFISCTIISYRKKKWLLSFSKPYSWLPTSALVSTISYFAEWRKLFQTCSTNVATSTWERKVNCLYYNFNAKCAESDCFWLLEKVNPGTTPYPEKMDPMGSLLKRCCGLIIIFALGVFLLSTSSPRMTPFFGHCLPSFWTDVLVIRLILAFLEMYLMGYAWACNLQAFFLIIDQAFLMTYWMNQLNHSLVAGKMKVRLKYLLISKNIFYLNFFRVSSWLKLSQHFENCNTLPICITSVTPST